MTMFVVVMSVSCGEKGNSSANKQNNGTAHLDDDEFARLTARLWGAE